eukprot:maker-scaffold_15-snap-gene-3.29-mRNA-1 protein AED:0.24 eAED:0.24 QI:76/1/1/1/1/1/2/295/431
MISGERKRPLSAREELHLKKYLAAERVREEKKLLSKKREQNRQDFLVRSAEKRRQTQKKIQEKRAQILNLEEFKEHKKQEEIEYLQEKLEVDRQWKQQQNITQKAEKEKEKILSSQTRFQHREFEESSREEEQQTQAENFLAKRLEFEDVQNYKKNQKAKQRESLHERLIFERSFKDKQNLQNIQQRLEEIQQLKLSQLEGVDVDNYKKTVQLQNRICLANRLQNSTEYKKKQDELRRRHSKVCYSEEDIQLAKTSQAVYENELKASLGMKKSPRRENIFTFEAGKIEMKALEEVLTPLEKLPTPVQVLKEKTDETRVHSNGAPDFYLKNGKGKTVGPESKSGDISVVSSGSTDFSGGKLAKVKKRVRFADPLVSNLEIEKKDRRSRKSILAKKNTSHAVDLYGAGGNLFSGERPVRIITFEDEKRCCIIS